VKTTLLNTFDKGGAGVASYRLHEALNRGGEVQSQLLYLHGTAEGRFEDIHVIANNPTAKKIALARLAWEKFWFSFQVKDKADRFRFSTAKTGIDISGLPMLKEADVVHLHWINNGFLSLNYIEKLKKLNKPIVWTMHDMWAMTGGCHHSRVCENYQKKCGNCFYLKNPGSSDVSAKVFEHKKEVYDQLDLTFIACSNWLAGRAKKSGLLGNRRVEVIPNPIDTDVYKPMDKKAAKEKFGLAEDDLCISFVAANVGDIRKGFEYLRIALWQLKVKQSDWQGKIKLLVMGEAKTEVNLDLPFEYTFTGYLNDEERIVDFYNASDVFVLPSLEENLPNTIMEALSCGVPSVAFEIGGIPDLIEHMRTGYLVDYESVDDLTEGISYVLNETQFSQRMQWNARHKATENYSYPIVADKVANLYKELLNKKGV
jgi:glycosyltransferase involved in cell wall biosynthesis